MDSRQSPQSGYWNASLVNISEEGTLSDLVQKEPKHLSRSSRHLAISPDSFQRDSLVVYRWILFGFQQRGDMSVHRC